MIKNIKLKHLMYDELILCYGLKDYMKTLGKYNLERKIGLSITGQCTSFYYEVDGYRKLIIGLKKKDDIDDVKLTLLHEVVHAVTFIMEAHDFECDEYRAYTTCSLYKECCDALWSYLSGAKES